MNIHEVRHWSSGQYTLCGIPLANMLGTTANDQRFVNCESCQEGLGKLSRVAELDATFTDFMILIETAIDQLESPEYELFATYYAPELARSGHLVERTPENEEAAKMLWMKLGMQILLARIPT